MLIIPALMVKLLEIVIVMAVELVKLVVDTLYTYRTGPES